MRRIQLDGVFVPHVTPFGSFGELDEGALRECVRFWLKAGVSGLIPCGSNGEAPYLSRDERKRVIEIVVDEVDGRVPVVAGTGSMSTWETIVFTEDAKNAGAAAALIVTPFYFRLSNRELYEHYRTVLEAVDLPVILYSVPKFTGFSLEPSVISHLAAKYDNVVGVKDSGGNIGTIAETIRLVGDRVSVLAGTADVALSTLMLGGTGAVIAVANVFPALCASLHKAFKIGNYEEASKLQQQLSYANEMLAKRHNQLSAIKEALKLRGLPAGYPRQPALPLEAEEQEDIEDLMKSLSDKA